MDVLIATENIRHFNELLRAEKGAEQRRILLELLSLEEKKLAVAAQGPSVGGNSKAS